MIEEINERLSQISHSTNKPGKPVIEELGREGDFNHTKNDKDNKKPLVTEVSRDSSEQDGEREEIGPNSADQERAYSQSSLGPTWATLQKLAEQVGSTIEREPIDIAKEKKAFVKRMQDTNLGDLD